MADYDVTPIRALAQQWIQNSEDLFGHMAAIDGSMNTMAGGWPGKAGQAAQVVWDGSGQGGPSILAELVNAASVANEIGQAINNYADELQKTIKEINKQHLIEALAAIFGLILGGVTLGLAGILGEIAAAVGELVARLATSIESIAMSAEALGSVATFVTDQVINVAITLGTDISSQSIASRIVGGPNTIDWSGEGINLALGVWAGFGMHGGEHFDADGANVEVPKVPRTPSGEGVPDVTPHVPTTSTPSADVGGLHLPPGVDGGITGARGLTSVPMNSVVETDHAPLPGAGPGGPVVGTPRTDIGGPRAAAPVPDGSHPDAGGPGRTSPTQVPGTSVTDIGGANPPVRQVASGADGGRPPHTVRGDAGPTPGIETSVGGRTDAMRGTLNAGRGDAGSAPGNAHAGRDGADTLAGKPNAFLDASPRGAGGGEAAVHGGAGAAHEATGGSGTPLRAGTTEGPGTRPAGTPAGSEGRGGGDAVAPAPGRPAGSAGPDGSAPGGRDVPQGGREVVGAGAEPNSGSGVPSSGELHAGGTPPTGRHRSATGTETDAAATGREDTRWETSAAPGTLEGAGHRDGALMSPASEAPPGRPHDVGAGGPAAARGDAGGHADGHEAARATESAGTPSRPGHDQAVQPAHDPGPAARDGAQAAHDRGLTGHDGTRPAHDRGPTGHDPVPAAAHHAPGSGAAATPGHEPPRPGHEPAHPDPDGAKSAQWTAFKERQAEQNRPLVEAEDRLDLDRAGLDAAWREGHATFARHDLFDGGGVPKDGIEAASARWQWRADITRAFRDEIDRTGHVSSEAYDHILGNAKASAYKYLVRADRFGRFEVRFKQQLEEYRANRFAHADDLPAFGTAPTRYAYDHGLGAYVKDDGKVYGHPQEDTGPGRGRIAEDAGTDVTVDHFRDRSHDFNALEQFYLHKRDELARILAEFLRDPERTGGLPASTGRRIEGILDDAPQDISRLADREHDISVATKEEFDDIVRWNAKDGEMTDDVAERVRLDFRRDLRADHDLVFAHGDGDGPRALWELTSARAIDDLPGRIAREQFVRSRVGEETLHAEHRLAQLGEDFQAHFGDGGRQRVTGAYLDAVRTGADRHFTERWGADGKAGDAGVQWADARDRLRSSLPARIRHEGDLQAVVGASAHDFHEIVGHPGSSESAHLYEDTLSRLGDDFRTERVARYDELFATEGHRTDAWLAHESHHEDGFQQRLDHLQDGDYFPDVRSVNYPAFRDWRADQRATPGETAPDHPDPIPSRTPDHPEPAPSRPAVPDDDAHGAAAADRDARTGTEGPAPHPGEHAADQLQVTADPVPAERGTAGVRPAVDHGPREAARAERGETAGSRREEHEPPQESARDDVRDGLRDDLGDGARILDPRAEVHRLLREATQFTFSDAQVDHARQELLEEDPSLADLPVRVQATLVGAALVRPERELVSAVTGRLLERTGRYPDSGEIHRAHQQLQEQFPDEFGQFTQEQRAGIVTAHLLDQRALTDEVRERLEGQHVTLPQVSSAHGRLVARYGSEFGHLDLQARADIVAGTLPAHLSGTDAVAGAVPAASEARVAAGQHEWKGWGKRTKKSTGTPVQPVLRDEESGFPGISVRWDPEVDPTFLLTVQAQLRRIAERPVGKALLEGIGNSGTTSRLPAWQQAKVKIQRVGAGTVIGDGPRFMAHGGNVTMPINGEAASDRERGTLSLVKYNPNAWETADGLRPPFIGLAHELIHVWRNLNGRSAVGAADDEGQVVGFREAAELEITENRIRAEHGLAPRRTYTGVVSGARDDSALGPVEPGPSAPVRAGLEHVRGREHTYVPFAWGRKGKLSAEAQRLLDATAARLVEAGVRNWRQGVPLPKVRATGYGNSTRSREEVPRAVETGGLRARYVGDALRGRVEALLRDVPGPKPSAGDFAIDRVSGGRREDVLARAGVSDRAQEDALAKVGRSVTVTVDHDQPQVVLGGPGEHPVEVAKNLHFVWLGGELSEAARRNLDRWREAAGRADWSVHLWTDRSAWQANAGHFDGLSAAGWHVHDTPDALFAAEDSTAREMLDLARGHGAFAVASDAIRYGALRRFGGASVDVDIAPGSVRLPEEPFVMDRDGLPFFAPSVRDRGHLEFVLDRIEDQAAEWGVPVPPRDEEPLARASDHQYGIGDLDNNLIVAPAGSAFVDDLLAHLRAPHTPGFPATAGDLRQDGPEVTGPPHVKRRLEQFLGHRWPTGSEYDGSGGRVSYATAFRRHHLTFDPAQRAMWRGLDLLTAESEHQEHLPAAASADTPVPETARTPEPGQETTGVHQPAAQVEFGPSATPSEERLVQREGTDDTSGEPATRFGLASFGEEYKGPMTAGMVARMLAGYRAVSTDAEVRGLLDEVAPLVEEISYLGPGAVGTVPRMYWPRGQETPGSGGHTAHPDSGTRIVLSATPYVEDQIATLVHELVHVSVHRRYGNEENADPALLDAPGSVRRFEAYVRSRVVQLVRLLPTSGMPQGWREASRDKLVVHVGTGPTREYDGVLAQLLIWSDLYGDVRSDYHRLVGDLVAETRAWRAAGSVTLPQAVVEDDGVDSLRAAAVSPVAHPPHVQVTFAEGERTTVAGDGLDVVDAFARTVARTAEHHARRGLPLPEVVVTGYGNGARLPRIGGEADPGTAGAGRAAAVADAFRTSLLRASRDQPAPVPAGVRITAVTAERAALPPGTADEGYRQNLKARRTAVIEMIEHAAGFDPFASEERFAQREHEQENGQGQAPEQVAEPIPRRTVAAVPRVAAEPVGSARQAPGEPVTRATESPQAARKSVSLDDLYGPAVQPKTVKRAEKDDGEPARVRLNPLWYPLDDFEPALLERDGVWVYAIDEEGRVFLGSEDVWSIAGEEERQELLAGLRTVRPELTEGELRESLNDQGVPTVGAGFDASGATVVGSARVGGELFRDPLTGRWTIDASSRYVGDVVRPGVPADTVTRWVRNAADRISSVLGMPILARSAGQPTISHGALVTGTGTAELDRDYGPLAGPKKVKDHERDPADTSQVRLNPLWYRLEDFTPALLQRTGGSWQYAVDEDGEISLGSDQVLALMTEEELHQLLDRMRRADPDLTLDELRTALEDRGHPTVAAGFRADGTTAVRPARISGELSYNPVSQGWELNNKSGRYMSFKIRSGLDPAAAGHWLASTARRISERVGVSVTPVLFKNAAASAPAPREAHDETAPAPRQEIGEEAREEIRAGKRPSTGAFEEATPAGDAADEHGQAMLEYAEAAREVVEAVTALTEVQRRVEGAGSSADAGSAAVRGERLAAAEERLDAAEHRMVDLGLGDLSGRDDPLLPAGLSELPAGRFRAVMAQARDVLGAPPVVFGSHRDLRAAGDAYDAARVAVAQELVAGGTETARELAAGFSEELGTDPEQLTAGMLEVAGVDLTGFFREAEQELDAELADLREDLDRRVRTANAAQALLLLDPRSAGPRHQAPTEAEREIAELRERIGRGQRELTARKKQLLTALLGSFEEALRGEVTERPLTEDEWRAYGRDRDRILRKLSKLVVEPTGHRGHHDLLGARVGRNPRFGAKRQDVVVDDVADLARGLMGWVAAKPNRHREKELALRVEAEGHVEQLLDILLTRIHTGVRKLPRGAAMLREMRELTSHLNGEKLGAYLTYYTDELPPDSRHLATTVPERGGMAAVLEDPAAFDLRDKTMVLHDLMEYFVDSAHYPVTYGSGMLPEEREHDTLSTARVDGEGHRTHATQDRGQNVLKSGRRHPSTRNENARSTILARALNLPVWAGQSFTAMRMFKLAEWFGASRQETAAVAWGIFSFWRLHYDHREELAAHTLHETLDIAQNFGVPYSLHHQAAGLPQVTVDALVAEVRTDAAEFARLAERAHRAIDGFTGRGVPAPIAKEVRALRGVVAELSDSARAIEEGAGSLRTRSRAEPPSFDPACSGRAAQGRTRLTPAAVVAVIRMVDQHQRGARARASLVSASNLLRAAGLYGGSRDHGVDPRVEGWAVGRDLTVTAERFGLQERAQEQQPAPAGPRSGKEAESFRRFSRPFAHTSRSYGYEVGDAGTVLLPDGVALRGHWVRFGDDFLHDRGYLLRGDNGWIGRVANWDELRQILPPDAAPYALATDAARMYAVPVEGGGRAVVLSLTEEGAAPGGRAATTEPAASGPLRYRDRIALAKRAWQGTAADEVAELERTLLAAGPGARSLVIGAVPGEQLWAVNIAGGVRWLEQGTGRITEPPRTAPAGSEVLSIDLDPRARLIRPDPRLLAAGGEAARFCELGLGTDLRHVV
ncbi:TcdA/TcdB catalytic glycosyltransferase domain-containing protein [Actinacidiphila yanglinensis]|uniref:TcdA/TcdB catalytic glycosyltransferase domain-containing protein n=1 Tax=Actinacidiphila yanglinensis TaxID=310779 RepID=A0A1H6E070_9ACTN|nr:M91 family zinc metallopeptidase [Actinacidiphila yanglinensis]SEG90513.1 TcdA/TcdB catalytic glycosyltransferase domain-containing protein [Actinacidiphila yanglinensis]